MKNEEKIIILTAKYVNPELQLIFGKIPPILLPYNSEGKTLLKEISKNNINSDIFTISSEGSQKINEEINQFNLKNVTNIEINESASLADSLFKIEDFIDGPFTLILGDTIVNNFSFSKYFLKDIISYSVMDKTTDSTKWTTFEINDLNNIVISDKITQSKNRYNVFNGIYSFLNFKDFFIYLHNTNDFYQAIENYYNFYKPILFNEENWNDFGNIENFKSNFSIAPREFNQISFNKERESITKSSFDKQKLKNEINWMISVPSDISNHVPSILNYSTGQDPFVELRYIKYPPLSTVYMKSSLTLERWNGIIKNLFLFWGKMNSYKGPILSSKDLFDFYYKKTLNRIKAYDKDLFDFFAKDIYINNKKVNGLNWVLNNLENIIKKYLTESINSTIVHGDYFFANIILEQNDKVMVIDPRGSFGKGDSIYGDPRYDLAKLSHSVRGLYDVIINDLFYITDYYNNIFNYKMNNSNNTRMIKVILKKYVHDYGFDYDSEILLIEALLFISMPPLHKDHPQRQKIMVARGLELLNEFKEGIYDKQK